MDDIKRIQKLRLSKISSNFSNQKKTESNVKIELRLFFIILTLREIRYLNKYCIGNKLQIKAINNLGKKISKISNSFQKS